VPAYAAYPGKQAINVCLFLYPSITFTVKETNWNNHQLARFYIKTRVCSCDTHEMFAVPD